MNSKFISIVLAIAVLGGCKSPPPQHAASIDEVTADISVRKDKTQQSPNDSIIIESSPYVPATPVVVPDNPVDLEITQAIPMRDLMETIASDHGWTIAYADGVDAATPVQATFKNVGFDDALAEVAALGGYTMVFDSRLRRATVAEQATWTFKLPANLNDPLNWNFSVGGDPTQTLGGGEEASGLSASSQISGNTSSAGIDISALLATAINSGDDTAPAIITPLPSLGLLLVRGNLHQLNRAHELIRNIIDEVTTRVEIRAAIIETEVSTDSEYGINWEKILNGGRNTLSIVGTNITNPTFSASISNNTLTGILEALRRDTDYHIVTRPNIVIDNHTPADLVDASVVPYLARVEASIDESGNISHTAESETVIDGLKLSVLPHVISDERVQLKLLPFIGNVPSFESFNFGVDGLLTLPNQLTKQAILSVTMHDNETLILAGNRVARQNRVNRGLGLDTAKLTDSQLVESERKEVAILINVRILPPRQSQPLIGKTL